MQFSAMALHYEWDDDTQKQQLIFCMRGDALTYVSKLPATAKNDLGLLKQALRKRFGDHILPETYRASLGAIKKQPKETLREYEARVRHLMAKAYPGMTETPMFEAMEIEYLIMGLPDPNMAFDILVRKPSSTSEALNLIEWYECCCTTQKKKSTIRQLHTADEVSSEETTPLHLRNLQERPPHKQWVTEERLSKFGADLRKDIVSDMDKILSQRLQGQSTQAMAKGDSESRSSRLASGDGNSERRRDGIRDRSKYACFNCQQTGHLYRECPLPKDKAKLREIISDLTDEEELVDSDLSEN